MDQNKVYELVVGEALRVPSNIEVLTKLEMVLLLQGMKIRN